MGMCRCRPVNDYELDFTGCPIHDLVINTPARPSVVNECDTPVYAHCPKCKTKQLATPADTCTICGATMFSSSLTFAQLRRINIQRCNKWQPKGIDSWSIADWGVAMVGEAGEMLNKIKKLKRLEDELVGNHNTVPQDKVGLLIEIADEIADVVIYGDLAMERIRMELLSYLETPAHKITLEKAIVRKFNEVSKRNGFEERL